MGTWIEILGVFQTRTYYIRRSLQWERGLKYLLYESSRIRLGRSLQWERGLKFSCHLSRIFQGESFPAMGTWIEMFSTV